MNRCSIAVGVAVATGFVFAFWWEHQAQSTERTRQQTLQQQLDDTRQRAAQNRPLPPLASGATRASVLPGDQWRELMRLRGELGVLHRSTSMVHQLRADNTRLRSNWVEQLAGGKKLEARDVAAYLRTHQRSAASLIAAAGLTGNPDLLREAASQYPTNAAVCAAAYFGFKREATPAENRQRLEAWKAAAPENALADYLSARAYLQAGDAAQALAEVLTAAAKPTFDDYRAASVAHAEEAYRSAGLSELEAAILGAGQPLPHLAELKGLGQDLGGLANRYRDAGDADSARAALQLSALLGRQVRESAGPGLLVNDLVGIAIERQALGALDPLQPYDTAGQTVKDRLDALAQQKSSLAALVKEAGDPLRRLSPADLATYYDRLRRAGEREALQWAAGRSAPESEPR